MKKFYLILCLFFNISFLFAQDKSWLENVTSNVGLDSVKVSYFYMVDVNNDHYPDLVIIRATGNGGVNRGHISLYLNKQRPGSTNPHDRIFVDATSWSNIDIKRNGEHGRIADNAIFADFDNDGTIDCITCIYYHRLQYYQPDSNDPGDRCELLLNNGWGQFTIKQNSGLPELGLTNATGFSALDLDKDGNLDLFISQWFKDYANNIMWPSILLKGNGDGTFNDISVSSGIAANSYPLYGINAVDWNNDGWPDLATGPYCRSSGSLWKNNGNSTFTDVASSVGYNTQVLNGDGWEDNTLTSAKKLCCWAAQPADFDNDGDMDFFYVLVHGGFGADVYGNNAGRSTLAINYGPDSNYKLQWNLPEVYRAPPRSSHLGDYSAWWFDIDNDMKLDLVMGNANYTTNTRLYVLKQDDNHKLNDISNSIGIVTGGKINYGEIGYMEVADYDLDGDDDILFTSNGILTVLENKIGQDNNWIGILLRPPAGVNTTAIGSRIKVYSGGVAQMRDINAGEGHFGGQRPFITNFGLAKNTRVDSIIVRWPTNPCTYTKVVNPPINDIYYIDKNGLWGSLGIANKVAVQDMKFDLYPNPANDELNIRIPKEFGTAGNYQIFDLSGRLVKSSNYSPQQSPLNISVDQFEAGFYYIRLVSDNNLTKSLPFIIAR